MFHFYFAAVDDWNALKRAMDKLHMNRKRPKKHRNRKSRKGGRRNRDKENNPREDWVSMQINLLQICGFSVCN